MSALFDRVAHVEGTIAEACKRANRSPAEVKLVAVTKTVPTDIIAQAYGAGLRVFGENRVQEAQPKIGKPYRRISSGTSSAICNRTKPRSVPTCST